MASPHTICMIQGTTDIIHQNTEKKSSRDDGIYCKGTLRESSKDWYRGELTREEAEQALKASGCDNFLIRQCQGVLVLSLIHDGEFHHTL